MVSSRMLSRSTSTSAMVVNLIEVLILLFYFLSSSSSLCIFLRAILREVVSTGLALSSLLATNLCFWGSYSIIFCNRFIYFSKFIFFVLSLIFSLVSPLFRSTSTFKYSSASDCPAASLPSPGSCCSTGSWSPAGCFSGSAVFYLALQVLLFVEFRQRDAFFGGLVLGIEERYQGGVVDGMGLGRTDIVVFLFLGLELGLGVVLAFESDDVFSLLCEVGRTIMRVISSFCSYFFISLKFKI